MNDKLAEEAVRHPATIASIVRALEATYTDEGVDLWLTTRNKALLPLANNRPVAFLGTETGRRIVADLVAHIDGCDPRDPEFSR